ncbi:MAG: Glucan 1,3-beta-glucosidase 3 [Pycnora praestabilis]|nr:MAG: Glucan 1,3-beta-glucosidase 3 [Pycnora praestabilis]
MKSLISKAKASLHKDQSHFPAAQDQQKIIKQNDTASTIQPPTPLEVLRYRYHHGTNLGSIFVLEQWLSGSMFVAGAAGGSELDAVNASLKQNGPGATRTQWENHWNTAVSDSDFDWLVNTAHCTTIRLPIGYFTLGPNYCSGTPFAGAPSQVYLNAWAAVKELVSRARNHGIGVLIDFHALPGGANGEAHSGTSSGQAQLWGNTSNLNLSTQCLQFIASEAKSMDGVTGIQLCNEAVYGASGIYAWYDSVISAIGQIDSTMPIYISDAWDLNTALSYTNGKNSINAGLTNPIIVDTHKYYCFADADKSQSPQQLIGGIPTELEELNGKEGSVVDHGAAQVLVGEYSCVLDGSTWAKVSDADRPGLVNQFGHAQSTRWQQRAGGSTFWTYKMDWMDGGEWGFVQQTNSSALTPPPSLLLSSADLSTRFSTAQTQRTQLKTTAINNHKNYWTSTAPSQTFEFYRFGDGYDVGFSDAFAFLQARSEMGLGGSGGDKIGNLDVWVKKRIVESGQGGAFVWEWEQGFRQGVGDFCNIADV